MRGYGKSLSDIVVFDTKVQEWEQKLQSGGYDVVAPDGTVWEFSHGEWTSSSYPGAKYDLADLAFRFAFMES